LKLLSPQTSNCLTPFPGARAKARRSKLTCGGQLSFFTSDQPLGQLLNAKAVLKQPKQVEAERERRTKGIG